MSIMKEYTKLLENACSLQPTDPATITFISNYIQCITNPYVSNKLRMARVSAHKEILTFSLEENQKQKIRALDFETKPQQINHMEIMLLKTALFTNVVKRDIKQNTQKPFSLNNAYQGLTDKDIYGRDRYNRYTGDRQRQRHHNREQTHSGKHGHYSHRHNNRTHQNRLQHRQSSYARVNEIEDFSCNASCSHISGWLRSRLALKIPPNLRLQQTCRPLS